MWSWMISFMGGVRLNKQSMNINDHILIVAYRINSSEIISILFAKTHFAQSTLQPFEIRVWVLVKIILNNAQFMPPAFVYLPVILEDRRLKMVLMILHKLQDSSPAWALHSTETEMRDTGQRDALWKYISGKWNGKTAVSFEYCAASGSVHQLIRGQYEINLLQFHISVLIVRVKTSAFVTFH